MDLNELLHSHQVAVMKASAAGDEAARETHFVEVEHYADRIREVRAINVAAKLAQGSPSLGDPLVNNRQLADLTADSARASITKWEGEGGALATSGATALPSGIRTDTIKQYYVGPYRFTDLGLALAEHARQVAAAARETEFAQIR